MFFSLESELRRSLRHARLGQQRAASGSPMLRLRSLEALAAIREASTAIDLWTTGPPEECAGSALAVARIDLVTAHLIRSELDAAEHAARPLLAVAPEQRTTIVLKRLNGLERHLSDDRHVGSVQAEQLGGQIEDFRATSTLHRLPGR